MLPHTNGMKSRTVNPKKYSYDSTSRVHLKMVSTEKTLPSVSLAEKMVSSLFKDTNMKSEREKQLFLEFLQWLRGLLVLCGSSTIEIKEIKQQLNLLRLLGEEGQKLKDCKSIYQVSFLEDGITDEITVDVSSKGRKTINDLSQDEIEEFLRNSESATVYLDWKQ
jgi:hypothetical protein